MKCSRISAYYSTIFKTLTKIDMMRVPYRWGGLGNTVFCWDKVDVEPSNILWAREFSYCSVTYGNTAWSAIRTGIISTIDLMDHVPDWVALKA